MNRTELAQTKYPSIGSALASMDNGVLWTHAPNPLAVWVAELSGQRDGFAVRLSACGASEDSALMRLDELLDAIALEEAVSLG